MLNTLNVILGLTFPKSTYEDGRQYEITVYDNKMHAEITVVQSRAEVYTFISSTEAAMVIIKGDQGYFRCLEF